MTRKSIAQVLPMARRGSLLALTVICLSAFSSAAPDCRVSAVPLTFGAQADATITMKAGLACPIVVRAGSASVDKLEILSMPQAGTVAERGRTGVTYRPQAGFKGEDSFIFAMRGRSDAHSGTSIVRVSVSVR